MKRKFIADLFIFFLLFAVNGSVLFAQEETQQRRPAGNTFSAITIIKVDGLKDKEDMDKVKNILAKFGYKVHSFKINFERKEVLIRMRQKVENEDLVAAFKSDGYKAWYDAKVAILQSDAVYRKK